MDLKQLLDYQKVDIDLKRANDEIERHEDAKKMDKARQEFNAAKLAVEEAEAVAAGIVALYNETAAQLRAHADKIETVTAKLTDDDEANHAVFAELNELNNVLYGLEQKLGDLKARSEGAVKEYVEAQERGKKMRDVYIKTKARFEEFRRAHDPKIKELKDQLSAMQTGIDDTLMTRYRALTDENIYPAFVPAAAGGQSCGGCGLELSQKAKAELEEQGLCRCETCRRVIYK